MKVYKDTIVILSETEVESKQEKISELLEHKNQMCFIKKTNENKIELFWNKNIDNIADITKIERYFEGLFTVIEEGAKFNKNSRWDGRKTFFRLNKKSDAMDIGFFNEFFRELKDHVDKDIDTKSLTSKIKETLWLIESELYSEIISFVNEDTIKEWIKNSKFTYTPYDHQIEGLVQALKYKKSLVRIPTSGGKSFLYYMYYKYFQEKIDNNFKFLLIVPNIQLIDQMIEEFTKQEHNIIKSIMPISSKHNNIFGMGLGDFMNPKKVKYNIFISTFQSLNTSDTNECADNVKEFLKNIDVIIVDEVHRSKVKTIQSVMKHSINCKFRFGQTGTFDDKNKWDMYHIFSIFRFNYKQIITTNELIDKGISSDFEIKWRILDIYKELESWQKKSYQEEITYISENKKREEEINKIISAEYDKDKNLLIFFHNQIVGKKHFFSFFNKYKGNVYYIDGTTNVQLRQNIKNKIESSCGNIVFASFYTTGTGIDFKNVHKFINIQSFKSKIITFQSLGRGLRKHDSKEMFELIEVIDKFPYTNYVWKHYKERVSNYKKEFGKEKVEKWIENNTYTIED